MIHKEELIQKGKIKFNFQEMEVGVQAGYMWADLGKIWMNEKS